MINKTLSKTSVIPISSASVPVKVYVSGVYKEYMDKYNKSTTSSRNGYHQKLYEYMYDSFRKSEPIHVYEVNDSQLDGRFVYVDASGLRVSDLPIQCFTMVPNIESLNAALKDFK